MRISSAILVATAALLALPVGWGVGVVLAYAVAGRDFGQPPVLTVPVSMVAAIVFALSLSMSAEKCLAIMVVGAAIFVLLALLSPHL